MMGLGDKEHNRRVREEREQRRPILTDTREEVKLWNIWIYYQKDITRQLAEQRQQAAAASAGGMPPSFDD
ncbi:hypothetical protein D3C72_2484020 [compost metagenome]